jgi:hypothetical protein
VDAGIGLCPNGNLFGVLQFLLKSFGALVWWGAVPFGDSVFLNLPSPDLRPGLMNAAALGGSKKPSNRGAEALRRSKSLNTPGSET